MLWTSHWLPPLSLLVAITLADSTLRTTQVGLAQYLFLFLFDNTYLLLSFLRIAVPYPKNPAPDHLTMPDFSKPQGGFGAGKVASNYQFQLMVIEEWDDGVVSVVHLFFLSYPLSLSPFLIPYSLPLILNSFVLVFYRIAIVFRN